MVSLALGLGLSRPSTARPVRFLAEGDSISAETGPASYTRLWAAEHPSVAYTNNAIGGAQLGSPGDTHPANNSLWARQAMGLAYAPTRMSVLIGANDLGSDASGYYANLLAYLAPFKAAGAVIILCTVLPRNGVADWETKRGALNTLLRAGEGTDFDYLVDFDTCPMGVAGAPDDADLYPDGLHPSAQGHAILKRVYATVVNWTLGIPNEPLDFEFAPVTGATGDTDYDSAEYEVTGLYPGEARPYSVQPGHYIKKNAGSFTLNGSGTVIEGDTLSVRNHSSSEEATETQVSATIGLTTAIFSVTTAGGSELWTPSELGSKLATWLRPETLSGATGDNVDSWTDESGNSQAWTLETSGGAGHPKLLNNAINGFNAVNFVGSENAWLGTTSGYLTGRTSSATFFVSKVNNDPPSTYFGAPCGGWGGNNDYWPFNNGGVYSDYARSGRIDNMNPTPSLAIWHAIMLYSAPNDWRFAIDGTNVYTESSNTVSMGSTPKIGSTPGIGNHDGQLAEVIDLNAAPTTTERQQIEGYLAWKYGLEANLPSGHPYEAGPPMI